jgi:hypothetical protein
VGDVASPWGNGPLPVSPATPPAPAPAAASPAPIPAPVIWYKSQRFIALCQSTAVLILGWLAAALSTNDWQWRAIGVAVLGNVLVALKDWWSPAVVAPSALAALGANKSNASMKAFTANGTKGP